MRTQITLNNGTTINGIVNIAKTTGEVVSGNMKLPQFTRLNCRFLHGATIILGYNDESYRITEISSGCNGNCYNFLASSVECEPNLNF